MIDLNKIEQSVKNLMRMYPESTRSTQSIGEVCELIKILRQAEKDAARYRWLRDTAHTVTGLTPCAFVMMDGELMEDWNGQYGLLYLGALDAAVDEAKSVNQA